MSTVGTAYVIIRAISPSLKKDITRAAEAAAEAASPSIDKIGERISTSMSEGARDAAENAGRAAAPVASKAGKRIGSSMSEGVVDSLDDKLGDSVSDATEKAVRKAGRAARPAAASVGAQIGEGLADSIPGGILGKVLGVLSRDAKPKRQGQSFAMRFTQGFADTISRFRVPPVAILGFLAMPAIGGLLQTLAAYVGGLVSLVSAIGPAFGAAGGVAVGSLFAMASAFAAVKLAFGTASPMLDRFKIAAGAVGEEFQEVGLAVQKSLLPRLAEALGEITGVIPTLKSGLRGVGGAVGDVAIDLANIATSKPVLEDLAKIFESSEGQIKNYGGSLGNLLGILTAFGAASGPVTTRFSKWTEALTASWLESTRAGQESGNLVEWMERAGDVAAQLGGIFGGLGGGLGGVFGAASESGAALLDRINSLTDRFDAWANSMGGQSALKTFFDNAMPVMGEVNGLIGDIMTAIFEPLSKKGGGEGIVEFVGALRTDVLPALLEIGGAAGKLAPSLIDLTVSVADMISAMSESGALDAFVSTLGFLIDGITSLFGVPVVGKAAGWALAFAGVAKAFDLFLKPFGGLSKLVGGIGGLFAKNADGVSKMGTAMGKIGGAVKKVGGGIGRFVGSIAKLAGGALGKIGGLFVKLGGALGKMVGPIGRMIGLLPKLALGIRSIGTAMIVGMGPVGWIIAGIVALGIALVVAYKKSETFRNFVNAIGSAIKNGFGAAVSWLTDVAWPAIKNALGAVGNAAKGLWETLKGAWAAIKTGIVTAWNGIKTAVMTAVQAVWDVIKLVFNGIKDYLTFVVGFWKGIILGAWNGIKTAVSVAINAVRTVITTVFNWVKTYIQTTVNFWKGVIQAAWGFIKGAVAGAVNGVRAVISTVFNWVKSYIQTTVNFWKNVIKTAWEFIKTAVSNAINRVKSIITTVINTVKTFMSNSWTNIKNAASNAWEALKNTVSNAIDKVKTSIRNGIDKAVEIVRGLKSKITGALKGFGTLLFDKGKAVIQGLIDGIKEMLGPLGKMAEKAAKAIADKWPGSPVKDGPLKSWNHGGGVSGAGRKLGKGLEEGLKAGVRDVERAAARMATAVATNADLSSMSKDLYTVPRFQTATAGATTTRRSSEPAPVTARYYTTAHIEHLHGVSLDDAIREAEELEEKEALSRRNT